MADESAVKVCVRVRPFIKREEADNAEPVQLHWKADKQAIHQIDDDGNMTKSFSFDRVFSAEESTKQLYNDIAKPLVVSTVEGYNGTIFAYGQTSSGKTFTMMGSEHNPGVIPLAMADVFHTIKNCPKKEFLLRVSYMEIYNETVTDLLCDSWKRKPLEIREGNYKNVYVADLTEELVTSPNQALAWIQKGEKNRHYGKTKMNQRSSRSHTIFRMILESRERSDPASGENRDSAIIVSHLNLVDLAGAERASQTGAEGARLKEGCNINRSLFTLGQVIKKLSDESQKGFTNYRDSKLTRILQNSLGGNAKTVIICTITPATVDETVSTLQFASTAKRMKNDPHVTEVSDDGALLRRYRDEIADLKQRLQEVSSITQTTATEKESLTQLLQEKDQLQREQADRIRNLTKLLVTSSNVGPVQKIPKRRVTWGGKLLKSPLLMSNDDGSPDMSFAEPFLKKRKADLTVTEESEDMEEFDTPCFYSSVEDCPMNQSNVTIRCSAEGEYTDSPQVHFRIECLERQLETETQEKQKAEEKSMMLEQRTEELEKQLQSLEQQLEVEVQEKQRAEQKCSTLELKVAEREKPSESEDDCKAREQCLEEAVQLCHTLSSEREVIAAERDLLKQRLELLMQDNQALVKNQETLLRDIEEQKDAEEFEKLEEETKKDYERELEAEISALKTALVDTEDLVQKLKSDLEMMSGELKKKNDLVADLQSLDGRDLVQEVTQLRRSLDDAEGLSLETKKEWAFLRSENLSLRERDATLTAQHNQMENEVKSLQSQLESEKTRFKKMQADLQKELLRAFDENTKLTALLDGKVPKNVLDNLTLEKTVAELKKELEKSQESEGALQSKMEELEVLPAKVEDLLRQVCEFSGELYSVQKERDDLISAQAVSNEDNERLKGEVVKAQEELQEMQKELTDAELKKVQLSEQYTETTEQLAKAQTDLEHLLEENGSLLSALEEAKQKSVQLGEDLESLRCERERHLSELTTTAEQRNQLQEAIHSEDSEQAENVQNLQAELQTIKEERDQLKKDMEENVELMIENQGELRASLEKAKVQEDKILQLEAEKAQLESRLSNPAENSLVEDLQIQVKQLKETLQSACTESDNIVSERALDAELERMQTIISSLTEERDQLQEILQVLREEKNHLKKEMEEKDELILRVQSDLNKEQFSDSSCVTSEENPVQLQQVQDLKKEAEELTRENSQLRTELQDLTDKVGELSGTLSAVQDEKSNLLVAQSTLNEQNLRVKEDLEKAQEELVRMESQMIESQLKEAEISQQHMETTEQLVKVQADLEHFTEENGKLLVSLEEANQKMMQLKEDFQCASHERERLVAENAKCNLEKIEELDRHQANIRSLTEEQDQLLDVLHSMREEKNQLQSDLDKKDEMVKQLKETLQSACTERDNIESERALDAELERMQTIISSLTEERDQLQEILQVLREEKNHLKKEMEEKDELILRVQSDLNKEQFSDSSCVTSEENPVQLQQVQDLKKEAEELTRENSQLRTELQDLTDKMMQLKEDFQCVSHERERLMAENAKCNLEKIEELDRHQANIRSLTEERDQLLDVLHSMREEKNQLQSDLDKKDEMVGELSGTLSAVQDEKSNLLVAQSTLNEENLRVKEDLEKAQEELVRMESQMIESQLKEAEISQQHMETTEQLVKVQADLEHFTEENGKLLMSLEEANQKMMQLKEDFQCASHERERLMAENAKCNLEKIEELDRHQANIRSLTEERDQLLDVLHSMREEKNQLQSDLDKKDEMIQELKELQTEREQSSIKDASCSTNVDEDGESLQEILQGVRELIQVQGELKQLKPLSPRATRKAELQQANQIMQVLKEEVGYLRNERMLLKKELQEAAETSKAYQNLLHSMKEEQKKQQQNVDSVTQSAEKDSVLQQQVSQLNVNLSYLREQLLSKKTSETQNCNTEMQTLLTRVVFLEEKANLQEETNLRCALQESEQTKHKLMEELQSLEGIKEQLLNEQTHAAQLQEVFHGVREERDQLQRELERKMEELSHIEKKVQGLEKEKMLLESKVSSLSQSLHEVNEHSNALSSEGRLKVILEFETCNTKLKVAFLKLQAIVDRPNRKDHLADANSKENVSFCQLLRFVPLSQRSVFTCLSSKTSHLDDLLRKNEVTLQRLAALHKAHFMKQVHSDVASFEERRLHDVLIRRAQAPSQSFQMVPGDFQEIWDQRLLELLDKRRQYLQNMNSILDFLEDAVAKHAVTLSEELQARTRANEEMRALAGSANATAIAQFFERELVRRTALADRQRNFRKSMLDKYDAAVSVLKPLEEESLQRLKEDRSESLALLPSPSSEKPKTEADLLQDKQRLSLQLQQAQKHLEVLQKKMEELKAQTDVSNQKHAAKLEELSSALKEKEDLIQNLQMKLKESEALAKLKRSPSAAEMEAMKDKLVKMELDHIAVTTGHEKEIAQLTAVVEHRGDVIYKLKETLRKTQQQGDRSFMVGEEPHSNPGTQAKASVCLKDKKIEELEKKSAQFESLVNKQQDEITKWKNRAYKLRESKKEAPHSPRTPTKRPLLTNSEVNSPKKMFLDSPKSKFFDVHADTEAMSLKCPKQFFDNSSLGTMPDSDPNAAGSSSDAESWWRIPNTSPRKTNLNLDANNCSTQ
ncbi:centromere-associated protein E isoform X2 [Neoarius graeffei]|uniref:centromere-associated protein E isoform X2 n=1 Tax=Neoarius graeffei TaxID=443677 RepID=UPI00298CF7D7|nr:centromere-associated protein E isoform X2 [Neoarius graeffei]